MEYTFKMKHRLYCTDIEGDNLLGDITKVYCHSYAEMSPKMEVIERGTHTDDAGVVGLFTDPLNILVMHNGIAFDGPAVEKVYGIKIQAEIVDTLFLSWYLYPKMLRHGLAMWGEELGIAKVEIDDWVGLTLEEYVNRCEVDVKIQIALWNQIWKHLMLLYGDAQGCWHVIRHLNFKAKQAALQEKSKWKLKLKETFEAAEMFSSKFEKAKEALEASMPEVPVKAKKTFPKKPYLMNGKLSATGLRWKENVEKFVDPEEYYHGDPLDYKQDITVITGYKAPNAGSSVQLKDWLYSMGWVPESFKYVRDKETNKMRKIPQVKNQETEELCESIVRLIQFVPALAYLENMSIVKHRLGVVNGFIKHADEEGFIYAAIQGLTNTLRFKHKICVNIPSPRKPYGELIRGLMVTQSEDTELCGSDMASLEDRTKQHFMWVHDPEYVREMMKPGFDPHCDMAKAAHLMTDEDIAEYKSFDKESASEDQITTHKALSLIRHGGKSTNYAATYGATGPTIARSAGVSEAVGDSLYNAYWERNWSLTAIADECIVKNSRGMKWLWNPVANMWIYLKAEKDRFSTLNQSTGTYAFDRWLYYILERREQLTAQFHDEGVWEIKKGNREAMTKILKDSVADVNKELKLNRELDCDVEFGDSYAEIH